MCAGWGQGLREDGPGLGWLRHKWQVEPDAGRAGTAGDLERCADQAGAFLHPGQSKTALPDLQGIETAAVIKDLDAKSARFVGETGHDLTRDRVVLDVVKRFLRD